MSFFEPVILGAIQGVTEWLPVSSEGMIVLVKNNFFDGGPLADTIKMALFLHLGTFLAALIYFRRDVKSIYLWINDLRRRLSTGELRRDRESGKHIRFLVIDTLISALHGCGVREF